MDNVSGKWLFGMSGVAIAYSAKAHGSTNQEVPMLLYHSRGVHGTLGHTNGDGIAAKACPTTTRKTKRHRQQSMLESSTDIIDTVFRRNTYGVVIVVRLAFSRCPFAPSTSSNIYIYIHKCVWGLVV